MKRSVSVIAILLLCCLVLTAFAACKQEEVDHLVIYNWADYIFDQDLEEFEAYYEQVTGRKIETTYVTFDTNETMLTRLTRGDTNVDVVCPSEYAIQKLIELDMLLPMHYFDDDNSNEGKQFTSDLSANVDKDLYQHNSGNVEQGILDKVNETFGSIQVLNEESADYGKTRRMTDYFVPYMYGTLGILYNKVEFAEMGIYDEEILNQANWGILFNDDGNGGTLSDKLTGKILMKDSIRDSYAATVFYLKESGKLDDLVSESGKPYSEMSAAELINAVDDGLLEKVKDALSAQKEQLFGYEVDFGKDDLLSDNAVVDLAWSGDAMYAVEESWDDSLNDGEGDYKLGYYVPHTYGNIWFDGWVVPVTRDITHTDAIKLFINYLNRPDVAARNVLEIGYSAAVNADSIKADDRAKAILAEGYSVYAPELWYVEDEDGNSIAQLVDDSGEPLAEEDYDYGSWDEFEMYFFQNGYEDEEGNVVSYDEISDSNWRYPFASAQQHSSDSRSLDSLGVMRDFGDKNHDVVTAWNYARSTGDTGSTLALLGWTALAVAVAVGAVALAIWLKRVFRHKVRLRDGTKD